MRACVQVGQVGQEQQQEGPAFDTTDFPSLGGAARQQQQQQQHAASVGGLGALGGGGGDPYANLGLRKAAVAAAVAGGATEFSIQSEDFPALPGTTQRVDGGGFPVGSGQPHNTRGGFPMLGGVGEQLGQAMAGQDYEQLLRFQQARAVAGAKSNPLPMPGGGGGGRGGRRARQVRPARPHAAAQDDGPGPDDARARDRPYQPGPEPELGRQPA